MFLFIYRLLINLVFILSPLIIIFRLFKKKESISRFKEKFCFFSKKKIKKKLIWFHGASVGELLSIIPVIEKFEKDNKIDQILVTTSTLSSAKVFEKFKFKKTIHQFFPIDTNFISNKFLNYWKPSLAAFVDSEIWPNMMLNLKKKSIPTILLNARITNKSFQRWKIFKNFSNEIFQCFTKALPCNKETLKYLKHFKIKNIKFIGNLKFSQKQNQKILIPKTLKNFLSKKIYWCASSTHKGEEIICLRAHLELKKKFKNLVTIIIPRHINRKIELLEIFKSQNLNVHCHSWKKNIPSETDIYFVDTYGETSLFFKLCQIVFIGGSIIKHGGQNPLEAIRFGCKIIHGPYTENFKDIYKLLKKMGAAKQASTSAKIIKNIESNLKKNQNSKGSIKKIEMMGIKILNLTLKELNQTLS